MSQPTIPPTQYQISDLVRNAVRSVLSAGQLYVNGGAIMVNRSDTSAEVPRMEVDVNNISRASTQMVQFSRVIVSGAGTAAANGTYLPAYVQNGKMSYAKSGGYSVIFDGDVWSIETSTSVLYSNNSPAAPWSGTWIVSSGTAPAPTVSEGTDWIYNHFAVDVSVKVVSDRYDGGAIHHEDMVQRVRYLMAREAQSFISPVVTFFEVLDIEEAQETHDIAEDVREDHSTLNYRMQLGLLPAVYAVPSVGHAA
jgi:hypothetical protein